MRFVQSATHWPSRSTFPAIVCRITDALTNEPMSLHFTFLDPAGAGDGKAHVGSPKLLLPGHTKKGGLIRLVDDAEVTTGLGLAEGVETALAVMAAGWSPVWSAIDSGNLGHLPVLAGIESITIFADHDNAGIAAANRLAEQWVTAGRDARIAKSPTRNSDWNDHIREVAHG